MLTILATVFIAFAAIVVCAILPWTSPTHFPKSRGENARLDGDLPTLPKPRFPSIEGRNIDGQRFVLPKDFKGLYNVAVITYHIGQIYDSDEWFASLRTLEDSYPDIHAYRIPVIGALPWVTRDRREFHMSSGNVDPQSRANTITLYTDTRSFNESLDIPDRSEITIAMVDQFGNVLWRERGQYTDAKFENLENTIINLLANIRIYSKN